ncbi:KAP family P-loop NTPase fold protein [Billgrantia ethanolica]|uniref:KAP NTPase domain-containing protein n=1 Tax=Billgrantia ethanolica TaxID=2733486 RepID=A0ABS9A9M8_9GAMM|nr:P-loop NTPase fold protein [Halomonas ethanolica]MCE8005138.1 hypothetical protein [Halomonas ethanolica]
MHKSELHKEQMPAYLDREVSSADGDKFGHVHLAKALKGLLEDNKHRPPYSIGLLGKWGTGKSTVKRLYLSDLQDDETRSVDGVPRRDRIYPITFNAWKYGGESDIRKSLFRHIFLEIGGTHEEADKQLLKTIVSTESRRKPLNELWAEFIDHYAVGLLVVAGFGFLFFVLVTLMGWVFGFDDPISKSVSIFSSAGLVGLLAYKFFTNLPILSARIPIQVTSNPSQTIEEFENIFQAQLQKFKSGRVRDTHGKKVRRIVVFIDDLDRLTADEMVSGLDGIRSLIEIASHQVPHDIGIVFVISCDEERVADALSKRRPSAELPAAVSTIQDARRYLDRIFQFRLEIPPFPKRDMRSFAFGLIKSEFSALQTDLKNRKVDIQELVDRMIHPGVQSPRNAIQIVNLFAQSWWLGAIREHGGIGSNSPGGLGEKVITDHPLTVGIICAIRSDFPDLYQALQRNPRIFDYFIDRFIRPEPIEELPAEVREELAAFSVDATVEGRWVVKTQHRGLRQFMSHIQDVRRPYSLQPFLALSQDPVSRKHGDKAVPIEEALRTTDITALLDATGLTGSTNPLSAEIGALVADLIDDLRAETFTIQDNAAFTVAEISQRIPENERRRILGFVVRRSGHSDSLRWRVGPTKLFEIRAYGDNEELRALGRSLVEDIAAETSKALLPTLQRPSLRELRELTDAAAMLVLELMKQVDLPPQAQQKFGQWLLHRTLKVQGQSDQLPLSWLEEQLSYRGDVLLPLIEDRYPFLVQEEFKKEEPENLDLPVIRDRVDTVFTRLFEQGAESRAALWDYLANFAALREPSLAEVAFTAFAQWYVDADEASTQKVFEALAARFDQHESDAGTWPLTDEKALRSTIVEVAEACESFSATGVEHMARLAQKWSESAERSDSAARLYSVIAEVDSEQAGNLSQAWAKQLFSDLQEPCQLALLAAVTEDDAPDSLRTQVASSISSLRGSNELTEHQIKAMSRLLFTLNAQTLLESPFIEQINQYIDELVSQISQKSGDFIVSKIEAVSENLSKLSNEKVTKLLNALAQLQAHPSILAGVYNKLSGSWPIPAAEGGVDFQAQKLFNAGIDTLDRLGQTNEAAALLYSLDDLHRRARLAQPENPDRLVASAYQLWAYDPAASEEIAQKYPDATRTSDQLANLVQQFIQMANSEENHDSISLVTVLEHEVSCADESEIKSATTTLLGQPAEASDGVPDSIMAMWVSAIIKNWPTVLVDTIIDTDITDEQASRLYNNMLVNVENLSGDAFLQILRETLSVQEGRDIMADNLVRSIETAGSDLFESDDEKRTLCEAVLSVFGDVTKRDRKSELARICAKFGLKNVVVDRGYIETLSENDIEIIEKHTGAFPG